jgi:hypothetical protein
VLPCILYIKLAEFPILRFKTDAFVADTQYMTAEMRGYISLLIARWRAARGDRRPQVRDNEREFAQICGVSLRFASKSGRARPRRRGY